MLFYYPITYNNIKYNNGKTEKKGEPC